MAKHLRDAISTVPCGRFCVSLIANHKLLVAPSQVNLSTCGELARSEKHRYTGESAESSICGL